MDNIKNNKNKYIQEWYKKPIEQLPSYQYWQAQEWLDVKRLRNNWFWFTTSITNNTVYRAKTSWLLFVTAIAWQSTSIIGYSDNNTNPTTVVASIWIDMPVLWSASPQLVVPVKQWAYYKVNSLSWISQSYFISL